MGSVVNMRILSAIAVLSSACLSPRHCRVSLGAPRAPGRHVSTAVSTAPTVDGVLGAGEWDDAPSSFLLFGELSGAVRFKHDSQYLYVALTVADSGVGVEVDRRRTSTTTTTG